MSRPLTTDAPRVSYVPSCVLVPPVGPRTVIVSVSPPAASRVSVLCDRVGAAIATTGVGVVTCDVGALDAADVGTVDALARMQLTARRLGGAIRLRNASDTLLALTRLIGLSDVLRDGEQTS